MKVFSVFSPFAQNPVRSELRVGSPENPDVARFPMLVFIQNQVTVHGLGYFDAVITIIVQNFPDVRYVDYGPSRCKNKSDAIVRVIRVANFRVGMSLLMQFKCGPCRLRGPRKNRAGIRDAPFPLCVEIKPLGVIELAQSDNQAVVSTRIQNCCPSF
jgi:hypothetical protein